MQPKKITPKNGGVRLEREDLHEAENVFTGRPATGKEQRVSSHKSGKITDPQIGKLLINSGTKRHFRTNQHFLLCTVLTMSI